MHRPSQANPSPVYDPTPLDPVPATPTALPTRIRAIMDRIVVKCDDPPDHTESGLLFVPDSAKPPKADRGEVVAVGDGEIIDGFPHRRPLRVKVGDVVMFGKYAGVEITVDGNKYWAMKEEDILVVLE